MAHFIVEYSANLDRQFNVQDLLGKLHAAAVATGVFPLGGIRLRAVRCEEYLVADGNPENAFVHVTVRMGHGRPLDVRKEVGRKLFAAFTDCMAEIYASRPLGLSLDLSELDPELSFKQNNMHK